MQYQYIRKTLTHALAISQLDVGNAVLYDITEDDITEAFVNKLQMVQSAAARMIAKQRKHHILHLFLSNCTSFLFVGLSIIKYWSLCLPPCINLHQDTSKTS